MENTPRMETSRLVLRKFEARDQKALFDIMRDEETNRFLPWFPCKSIKEAARLLESYLENYEKGAGQRWAVCEKEDDVPIGYVHVASDDSHDFGYGFRHEFWGRGYCTEAASAAVARLAADGLPYITATHDVENPKSGAVMQKIGMHYQYSYQEDWQPKNIPVIFRMYQLNFDGNLGRRYEKYWEKYPHFIEQAVH